MWNAYRYAESMGGAQWGESKANWCEASVGQSGYALLLLAALHSGFCLISQTTGVSLEIYRKICVRLHTSVRAHIMTVTINQVRHVIKYMFDGISIVTSDLIVFIHILQMQYMNVYISINLYQFMSDYIQNSIFSINVSSP